MGGATAAGPVPPVPDFIAFKNVIANTGVEHIDNPPAYLINSNIPVDGGFGKPPATVKRCVGGANNDLVCSANDNCPGGVCIALGFGDGTFDAPVVIEAAATPPYFHNNSVPTLEAAVGFYCSPEFQERLGFAPPDGINFAAPLNLKTDLATSIAAFLRAAGSMELIDRGMGNCQEAISGNSIKGKYYINIAMANARDAIKVLKEGVYLLYPEAQEELDGAYSYLSRAMNTAFLAQRDKLLRDAKAKLAKAKGMICQ
jgi:hypothetical protein